MKKSKIRHKGKQSDDMNTRINDKLRSSRSPKDATVIANVRFVDVIYVS